MKRIEISNGEVRMGYEINDLHPEVKEGVIGSHRLFLEYLDEEDEQYEYTDEEVIDSIEINGYLFDETGCSLPVVYHMVENKIAKTVYNIGDSQYECTLTQL